MKKKMMPVITAIFVGLTMAITIAAIINNVSLQWMIKPLLMPALLFLLLVLLPHGNRERLIITGLIFSWLGDVLLLFENEGALFFIAGLLCFLITHLCYIIYFLQINHPASSLIRKQPWMAALLIAYCASLVMYLWPSLAALRVPVLVYAVVICVMLICSLHVFYKTIPPSGFYFAAGALLFAFSDSVLAIQKFSNPFEGAAPLIISTYCMAQYLIVSGTIIRKKALA